MDAFGGRRSVIRVAAILMVLALVAAGIWAYLAFRTNMRAARDRLLSGSRVVPTDCGPIEVAEVGDGPPVLVVHGTGGGYDQGMTFARDWVGEEFHSIAISRFGYLRTPMPPDSSSAAQADALACALDTLEIPSVSVIGVSAGAHPAAQLALRYPQRVEALALVVPALYIPPEPGATGGPPAFITDYVLRSDFLVWLMVRLAPGSMLRVAGVPPSMEDELPQQQRKELLDGFSPATERHAGLANDVRKATRGWPDLPIEQLRMPVLLLGAADDPYRSASIVRYSEPRIPDVRAVVLERGGHVLVGKKDEVMKEVQAIFGAHTTTYSEPQERYARR